jgi:hypothetical protein
LTNLNVLVINDLQESLAQNSVAQVTRSVALDAPHSHSAQDATNALPSHSAVGASQSSPVRKGWES